MLILTTIHNASPALEDLKRPQMTLKQLEQIQKQLKKKQKYSKNWIHTGEY